MVPTIFGNGGMRRIGLPVHSSVSYFWVVCDHCCVWSPITSPPCFLSFAQNHVQKLSHQQGQGPGHPVWVVWVIVSPRGGPLEGCSQRGFLGGVFPSEIPRGYGSFPYSGLYWAVMASPLSSKPTGLWMIGFVELIPLVACLHTSCHIGQ